MKKLKILLVAGWVPPDASGGVATYLRNLVDELSRQGHRVFYFYSGEYDWRIYPHLKVYHRQEIEYASLLNSPSLHFNSVKDLVTVHCTSTQIEKLYLGYLDRLKPEIVHFHNLEGLCVSLLKKTKEMGYPVFNTLHNYWLVCPRVEMVNSFGVTCTRGFAVKCGDCYRFNQRQSYLILKRIVFRYLPWLQPSTSLIIKTGIKPREPAGNKNIFEYRNDFIRRVLNQKVDINFAVSKDVKKHFVDFGVKPNLIKIGYIGTKVGDLLKEYGFKKKKNEYLTFGFLGSLAPHKGVTVLIKAFKKLDQSYCRLLIYAPLQGGYLADRELLERKYNIRFCGGYQYQELPKILAGIDVGVVPSLVAETGPQTVMEFLAAKIPVIGSNIGGIPDFVKNDTNGFLFKPGSVPALVGRMRKFIDDAGLVHHISQKIRPVKSIKVKVDELEKIYYKSLCN